MLERNSEWIEWCSIPYICLSIGMLHDLLFQNSIVLVQWYFRLFAYHHHNCICTQCFVESVYGMKLFCVSSCPRLSSPYLLYMSVECVFVFGLVHYTSLLDTGGLDIAWPVREKRLLVDDTYFLLVCSVTYNLRSTSKVRNLEIVIFAGGGRKNQNL